MIRPGTLGWFAAHEARLAWRDWVSMMTAGKPRRARIVAVALIAFAAFMHVVAYRMLKRIPDLDAEPDKVTLVVITGSALLAWSLMLSQAMESVTRAFYARADLELVLSSPAQTRRIFSVRIAIIAFSTALMAVLLAAPFVNVLVARSGMRWLAGYGVVAGMGAAAAAVAVALTVALFRTIGPKRTRLAAQIVAAVIGAAFVIGVQAGAILSYGTLSGLPFLESDPVVTRAPEITSAFWCPARAILGDLGALAAMLAASLALLLGAITVFSTRFGERAVAAAGVGHGRVQEAGEARHFRAATPQQALWRKEWILLKRDPWLVSQTLMQVLYLLPPALLLWRSFGQGLGPLLVLVPVVVMAAGQLAGGLAWLAISGEDAPDLVASAPVPTSRVVRAKIEMIMCVIALVFGPFLLAMAIASPFHAAVATAGIAVAAASSTMIQLWFRAQVKRSHFRHRHTSSRIATFAEAFSSIAWAGTAALAAAGTWLAIINAIVALGILAGARLISPPQR